MAFAFDTLKEQVLEDVWLSEDYFAETVTFRPIAGADQLLVVHISAEHDQEYDTNGTLKIRERLRVLISRVEDEEANTKGFVRIPTVGAQIIRDYAHDPLQQPYIFQGEVADDRPQKWRLTFERERVLAQGAGR